MNHRDQERGRGREGEGPISGLIDYLNGIVSE